MECNKDEAARAKELAETKLSEKDYAGAKKFALKALNLYPSLDGLTQFMTTLDVYTSAEKKISGVTDWYNVLGVTPYVDDELLKKQYRKLILALHPDKNKSPGAEGAFKLVSEAWSLLSDKAKRQAYNQKRSSSGFQHNAPNCVVPQPQAPNPNGGYFPNKKAASNARTGSNNPQEPPASVPPPYKKVATFWTVCTHCRIQLEYPRIYLNHPLRCPICSEAFVALEKVLPAGVVKSSNLSTQQHQQNSQPPPHATWNHPTTNPGRTHPVSQNKESSSKRGMSFSNTNFQCDPHSRMHGIASKDSSASTPASVKKQASVTLRTECEGSHPIAARERSQMYKRPDGSFNNVERTAKKMRSDDIRMYMPNSTTKGIERRHGFSGFTNKNHGMRELSAYELRNMLINKSQNEIRKKLQEWKSRADEDKDTNKDKGTETQKGRLKEKTRSEKQEDKVMNKEKGNLRQKGMLNDKTTGSKKHEGSTINGNGHLKSDPAFATSDDSGKEYQDYTVIPVLDSDFHNFDLERAENSFAEDQVWAAYDDDDGMPRFYAKVQKVLSMKPFKMCISWLNSRSNKELGPMDWIDSGFYKTCGDFNIGRREITESLNSFSHKVRWTKGTRGVVRIFPRKGDIWALYRNWSLDWNEDTPDEVKHQYDMVEVIEDYNDKQGVLVTPLIKVDGFLTVFQKIEGRDDLVRKIPKVEIFRFSHQVPNYLLTGEEAHNAPKGCVELDPAATSLDLLQTKNEANEALNYVGKSNKEDTA
ncbi:hypothetical protein PIB30_068857 [Stylosanthes scabra]|uniref:J domain-containing protein n=1 Tax=Stylosanthes scabra TaxID=79078 RepID=A0ABU6TN94_9FABA|nr:hypothetical protein [Stylosanthes scabra]